VVVKRKDSTKQLTSKTKTKAKKGKKKWALQ
jgi:hypothetical protein